MQRVASAFSAGFCAPLEMGDRESDSPQGSPSTPGPVMFCQQTPRTEDTRVRGSGRQIGPGALPAPSLGFLVCTRRTGGQPPRALCGSANCPARAGGADGPAVPGERQCAGTGAAGGQWPRPSLVLALPPRAVRLLLMFSRFSCVRPETPRNAAHEASVFFTVSQFALDHVH